MEGITHMRQYVKSRWISVIALALAVTPALEAIEMSQLQGWQGAGSLVTLTTTSAQVKIAVLRHQ